MVTIELLNFELLTLELLIPLAKAKRQCGFAGNF